MFVTFVVESVSTGAMPYLLVRHAVEDYAAWKDVFDEHAAAREEAGSLGGRLFRSSDDAEDVVTLMEWESAERAREFAESDDLRETMERAGVVGEPEVAFLEELESFDS